MFQSEESSTEKFGPIFNRISWKRGKTKDIWIMQQSQKGLNAIYKKWDRLVIVVDKMTSPKTAHFIQTNPGAIAFKDHYKDKKFRVACGMCHSNGPRAIRPVKNSDSRVPLSWKDQLKIIFWNLRIKTYGRVISQATQSIEGVPRKTPLKYHGVQVEKQLNVQGCTKCHNDSWWGRGELTLQNFPTIRFMMEKKYMPPKGFGLSAEDEYKIRKFLSEM